MPGPPPNPQRRRRNLPTAVTRWLPAAGRQGPPPPWPLSGPTEAEEAAWAEVWALPVAVAWETLWTRTIARYVRCEVASEELRSAALLAEVRLLEHALGLSPMSQLRLRWEIEPGEAATVSPIAKAPRRRLNLAEDKDEE